MSSNGRLIEDESNKCGIVFCPDARLAFGYTGLARYGSFKTIEWLIKALCDSGPPTFIAQDIIERLRENATKTFLEHPSLQRASRVDKKLTIMFSGYIYGSGVPQQGYAILSNYVNLETYYQYDVTQDDFRVRFYKEIDVANNPTLIQRVGNWSGIRDEDIYMLRQMLTEQKPRNAILNVGVDFIRELASRGKSANSIGKQLTSICIPSDLRESSITDYHSNSVRRETYMPAQVFLFPDRHGAISNISIKPVEDDTPPMSVPKVSKNAPCPCGSKLRYKSCHGKREKTNKLQIGINPPL